MKLISKRGIISIPEDVIAAISGYAAMNCFSVKGLTKRGLTSDIVCVPKGTRFPQSVKIKMENGKVDIELHIAMEHGVNLRAAGNAIMGEVRYMVESATGIKVGRVNVFVDAIIVS